MKQVDVVIIGAGPAGGSAALALASSSLKVAVLEQASLPRLKPCGGLMPASVLQRMGWDFTSLVKHAGDCFCFSKDYADPVEKHLGNQALLLVERAEFDQALVQEAINRSSGKVALHEDCRVQGIEEHDHQVVVSCDGGQSFCAQALIGADGVNGVTARKTRLNPDAQSAVAIDADLCVSKATYDRWKGGVAFNFFCIPIGYGWVFPKEAGRLSAGLLSWGEAGGIRTALDAFIARNFDASEINKKVMHGYPIPRYRGMQDLARKRVCLAGDAAGLVDPVSGEGIRFAVESGLLAAQGVIDMLSNGDNAALAKGYLEALSATGGVCAGLDYSRRFVSLAFQGSPEFFYKHHVVQSNTPFYW